jgi:hypothetical protein
LARLAALRVAPAASEVGSYAALFPIAVSRRIRALAPTDFALVRFHRALTSGAARLGFLQGALGGSWSNGLLLRICHGAVPCRHWLLATLLPI